MRYDLVLGIDPGKRSPMVLLPTEGSTDPVVLYSSIVTCNTFRDQLRGLLRAVCKDGTPNQIDVDNLGEVIRCDPKRILVGIEDQYFSMKQQGGGPPEVRINAFRALTENRTRWEVAAELAGIDHVKRSIASWKSSCGIRVKADADPFSKAKFGNDDTEASDSFCIAWDLVMMVRQGKVV